VICSGANPTSCVLRNATSKDISHAQLPVHKLASFPAPVGPPVQLAHTSRATRAPCRILSRRRNQTASQRQRRPRLWRARQRSIRSNLQRHPVRRATGGRLRWREPQPVAAWLGTRQADKFSASCIQEVAGERKPWTYEFMTHGDISEDCLYLNVWTSAASAAEKRPVFVYIYGGGFSRGIGAGARLRWRGSREERSGGGDVQLPRRRVRVPGSSRAGRRVSPPCFGKLRDARSIGGVALGA
jgi:hypothetical protein